MLKRLFNTRERLVRDSLEGLLRSSLGGHLMRLDTAGGADVVIRKDWKRDRVALISGGGAGHEPAHAGFVGEGMLTAAVCGALFTSPGIDAILSAIIAVTGPAGCLLIVKNYTGDRLNFGIAAEQARAQGYKVAMVIVHDDIALGVGSHARGIAGTILVHKIAGYHADKSAPLADVTRIATEAAQAARSLGLAMTDCNVYDPTHRARIAPDKVELGLGIHGEAGVETRPLSNLDTLVATVASRLSETAPKGGCVVMINTLGAVTPIESFAIVESFGRTALAGRTQWIIGPAAMMTALDMVGFSFTVLPAQDDFLKGLDAAIRNPFWPGMARFAPLATVPAPPMPKTFTAQPSACARLETCLRAGLDALISAEIALNALDAKIGDGDAGNTFASAAREILKAFPQLPFAKPHVLCATLGRLMARHAGGSSGVLLSILLTSAGTQEDWRQGLCEGLTTLMRYSGAQLGDRTMLDALIPAVESLTEMRPLEKVAQKARSGANATRDMPARAGRAAYVPAETLRQVTDPGAEAVARFFEALAVADHGVDAKA